MRSGTVAAADAPAGDAPEAVPLAPEGTDDIGRAPRSRLRDRLVPLALALIVVALFVKAALHTPTAPSSDRAPPARVAPRATGTLVWISRGDPFHASHGHARLYAWDLATGVVQEGPLVEPGMLVDASDVGQGSVVGVVSREPDGSHTATLVHLTGAPAHAQILLSGAVVSWRSGTPIIEAVQRSPSRPGCPRRSGIVSLDLADGSRSHDLQVCGAVPTIARSGVTTFFTRRSPSGSVRIDYVGYHREHLVLRGYALLGASPQSDLIVTRPGSRGAGLFWQGNAAAPVPFAADRLPLHVRTVLAWSPDGSVALAQGRLGDRSGVWALAAGAGSDRSREPVLVVPTTRTAWATYASDGTAYLVVDGTLRSYGPGGVQALSLPATAPVPTGAVVWLPGTLG